MRAFGCQWLYAFSLTWLAPSVVESLHYNASLWNKLVGDYDYPDGDIKPAPHRTRIPSSGLFTNDNEVAFPPEDEPTDYPLFPTEKTTAVAYDYPAEEPTEDVDLPTEAPLQPPTPPPPPPPPPPTARKPRTRHHPKPKPRTPRPRPTPRPTPKRTPRPKPKLVPTTEPPVPQPEPTPAPETEPPGQPVTPKPQQLNTTKKTQLPIAGTTLLTKPPHKGKRTKPPKQIGGGGGFPTTAAKTKVFNTGALFFVIFCFITSILFGVLTGLLIYLFILVRLRRQPNGKSAKSNTGTGTGTV